MFKSLSQLFTLRGVVCRKFSHQAGTHFAKTTAVQRAWDEKPSSGRGRRNSFNSRETKQRSLLDDDDDDWGSPKYENKSYRRPVSEELGSVGRRNFNSHETRHETFRENADNWGSSKYGKRGSGFPDTSEQKISRFSNQKTWGDYNSDGMNRPEKKNWGNSWSEKKTSRFSERNDEDSDHDSQSGFGRSGGNANLSVIGRPSKWKVGAGFESYANELRKKVRTQDDFLKWNRQNQKKKASVQDTGIRRQMQALGEERQNIQSEEFDDEVDIMKSDKVYDLNKQEREAAQEQVKMKIVQRKYFKTENEKILTPSEKEQIRYLHNTDPETWTYEIIADQFKIDVEVAKAVAKAKWVSSKPKEDTMVSNEEIHPLTTTSGTDPSDEVSGKRATGAPLKPNKKVTWKELRASMGVEEDVVKMVSRESETTIYETETIRDEDLVQKYILGSQSKWASSANTQSKDSVSNQTQLEGIIQEKLEDGTPVIKEGEDLLRKGDDFYSQDGEFLYRVPNLPK